MTDNLSAMQAEEIRLIKIALRLHKQTHTGTALLLSAMLEQFLVLIFENNMPHLSNRLKPKLFEGYGPLGSFSAKIDIAYALGFITALESRTLHAVRGIRNTFAHSSNLDMSFDHEDLVEGLAKLPGEKKKGQDNLGHFTDVAFACHNSLQQHFSAKFNPLEEYAIEQKSSKKK